MSITSQRVYQPSTGLAGEQNIRQRHPIEAASWIWHPQARSDETAVLRFHLPIHLAAATTVRLHVSADQRYQMTIDGESIGYGPDRGDALHWACASYDISLAAGDHVIESLVWWLATGAPLAQHTLRGGFIVAGEGVAQAWSTGTAKWQVERLEHAMTIDPAGTAGNHCGYAGHAMIMDAGDWAAPRDPAIASVVIGPVVSTIYGEQRALWQIEPSYLPEQRREPVGLAMNKGSVRSVWDGDAGTPVRDGAGDGAPWEHLWTAGTSVTVPAHTTRSVLVDLGVYVCGYPQVCVSGGAGTQIRLIWCESLYEGTHTKVTNQGTPKGQRDAVDGKVVFGLWDTFVADGGAQREFPALWWRSGRFMQVVITTKSEPVTFNRLGVLSTAYPFHEDASFACDDPDIAGIWPLLVRGLHMSAHETWVDCPYYEQLMYVGDTRTEALTAYTLSRDDRLSKRCLELFDWSRVTNGWVAERYPSRKFQASGTYALLWPLCVADHYLWRGDADFARARLPGIRSLLELGFMHRQSDGRCGRLPGWSFVDWVKGHTWETGMGPGVEAGDSVILDLHLILACQAAATLEEAVGDTDLAQRLRRIAANVGQATVQRHWCSQRRLLRDAVGSDRFSEHAQCLAVLAKILSSEQQAQCVDAWLAADDLAPCTVYFQYYPLEVLAQLGRGGEILKRLSFWRGLQAQGFTTTVEAPEPARSDCHGWGAHPLHHLLASIAGIRPLAPGLQRVRIAPQFGELTDITAAMPHPAGGLISVQLKRTGTAVQGSVSLPPGISGEFYWHGSTQQLRAGQNQLLDAAHSGG